MTRVERLDEAVIQEHIAHHEQQNAKYRMLISDRHHRRQVAMNLLFTLENLQIDLKEAAMRGDVDEVYSIQRQIERLAGESRATHKEIDKLSEAIDAHLTQAHLSSPAIAKIFS